MYISVIYCKLLHNRIPQDTTGLLESATVRKSSIIFDPRKSWQHLSQKCMKPRGYRGACIYIQFERFEKDHERIWETQRIPAVNKTQHILIYSHQQDSTSISQKCMKHRGYRGACIYIQFERFEKDHERIWKTERIQEVNKIQNIVIYCDLLYS